MPNLLCPFLRDRWLHGTLSNNAGKMVLVTSARKGAFLLSLYPSQFVNSCCFALKVCLRFHYSSRRRHNQRPSTSSHHPGQQPRNKVRTRRQIGSARWNRLPYQRSLLKSSPCLVIPRSEHEHQCKSGRIHLCLRLAEALEARGFRMRKARVQNTT